MIKKSSVRRTFLRIQRVSLCTSPGHSKPLLKKKKKRGKQIRTVYTVLKHTNLTIINPKFP